MIDRNDNPEYLNDFLAYNATILNKSPNTVKEYNYDLAHFLKFIRYHFGEVSVDPHELNKIKEIEIKDFPLSKVAKIELQDIHAFLQYLKDNYRSKAATLARKVAAIRTFFNYLCNKMKLIPNNPTLNLDSPKLDKRLPKYLTLDESRRLLETSAQKRPTGHGNHDNQERDFCMITLLLNCGMRLSELIGINISDIDFDNRKLTVIGKGNKERTIYLNDACIDSINQYLAVRPRDQVKWDSRDALFLSEQRKRISKRSVEYIVKREIELTNIERPDKYSVHKLRHTAATLMYKYGNVDIRALQELLGHKNISTTEIYTHVDNEQIRSAVESNPLSSGYKNIKTDE